MKKIKDKSTKGVEDKSIKYKQPATNEKEYNFPSLGKTVKASSLEEAQKKVNYKDNK